VRIYLINKSIRVQKSNEDKIRLKKLHARARADLEAHEGPKDAIFLGAQECH